MTREHVKPREWAREHVKPRESPSLSGRSYGGRVIEKVGMLRRQEKRVDGQTEERRERREDDELVKKEEGLTLFRRDSLESPG